MFYRQRNKQPASCSWCQSQTPGPHWHCRSCLFDVCISCAQQRGYISPATSAKCKNKHPLTEKNSDGRILPCLMCKKMFNGKCFLCVDCNYVICDDCQNFLKSPAPGHPIVRCTEKHLLRWHTRGGFNCDACNQNKDEERFKCKECNYDICADCSNSLIASICKTGPKCCPQLHQLLWCFETNEIFLGMPYKCDGCKRINKRIGSYRCAECELDICFTCMAKQSNN